MKTPAALLTLALTMTLGSCSTAEQITTEEEAVAVNVAEEAETTSEPERRMPEASAVFDTPWPTDFSRTELSDTALAKMNTYIDSRVGTAGAVSVEMVFQDTIDEWHWDWTTDLAELSLQVFSDYPVPDPLFIIGSDQQFMIDEIDERGRETHPVGGACGHVDTGEHIGGCAYKGITWQSMHLPDENMFGDIQKNLLAIVPHEYFHLVQDNLDPGPGGQTLPPGDPFYRPVWFVEGTAHFIGLALINYAGIGSYDDNYPWYAVYAPAEETNILSEFEKYGGGYGPYDFGQLATEYIVANVGLEALINIWVYLGEGDSFETAFERAIGISVADFYAAYDTVIANLAEDGIALRSD